MFGGMKKKIKTTDRILGSSPIIQREKDQMDKEIEATAKEILKSLKLQVEIDETKKNDLVNYGMKGNHQEIQALAKALDAVAKLKASNQSNPVK